jgi:hypothetical protein
MFFGGGWSLPETLIDGYELRPVTKLGVTKYQFLGTCYLLQNVKEGYSGIKSLPGLSQERAIAILSIVVKLMITLP